MRRIYLLFILILFCVGCAVYNGSDDQNPQHLILISIDGLRPEFYIQSDKYETKNLERMKSAGCWAKKVEAVYPSVTYPAHATIATGVYPVKHGIISNTIFDSVRGSTGRWYWEEEHFKVPTLWQIAKKNGLKVALILWPSAVGADVDYLIAEIWDEKGFRIELIKQHSTKGLIDEIVKATGETPPEEFKEKEDLDRYLTKAASYIIKKYKPELVMLHLLWVDGAQHQSGRDSEETKKAVKGVDECIGIVLDAIKDAGIENKTTIFVVGDHGFIDVANTIYPNSILKEAGLIEVSDGGIKDWKALAHVSGAQCAIYLKDPKDEGVKKRAMEFFKKYQTWQGKKIYNIITREELDKLGALPGAFISLECEEGYTMGGKLAPNFVEEGATIKGNHGNNPKKEKMYTGFIAYGCGIKKGKVIQIARLIDIAPTAAKILNLEMKDTDGKVLEEILR